nr:ferrous iron transport protein A [Desulforamulus ruminis]
MKKDKFIAGSLIWAVVPGVTLEVKKYAPLGDPMEVKLKSFHLRPLFLIILPGLASMLGTILE